VRGFYGFVEVSGGFLTDLTTHDCVVCVVCAVCWYCSGSVYAVLLRQGGSGCDAGRAGGVGFRLDVKQGRGAREGGGGWEGEERIVRTDQ
jgi:hypothetical protein